MARPWRRSTPGLRLVTRASSHEIGTGRGHSRSLVLELDADRFVALETERLEDAVGQADLVFDAAGGDVLARSASVLKPGGTLVSVAAFPPFGRPDATEIFLIQEENRVQLTEVARLVDKGHLRPQVGAVYPLAQAAEAYSAKAAGGVPAGSSSRPDH
jgi:NADPH:quinone reductase-like Zn-dependent oxidoreductase